MYLKRLNITRHHDEFYGFILYFMVMEEGTKRKENPMVFDVK